MKTRFISAKRVAEQIFQYDFEKPKNFKYIAGQFIQLHLPQIDEKRWFTLSSSPTEDILSVTTKHSDPSSNFKQALENLKRGDICIISEPMGDFILPRNKSKQLLFVAGGIGITPYRSMSQYLLDKNEARTIKLLYASSHPSQIAFKNLLESTLDVKYIDGKLSADIIKSTVKSMQKPQIYISGPEPMVESLHESLKDTYNQSQLLRDYFPNYTSNY